MSSNIKHTPEPWAVFMDGQAVGEVDGSAICSVWARKEGVLPDTEGAANARRIVACVNACAGIPTECLESGPEAVAPTPIYQQLQHKRKELNAALSQQAILEIQRDQLLAALVELRDQVCNATSRRPVNEAREAADIVIARVKGGAA